jgi:hypothetical protein
MTALSSDVYNRRDTNLKRPAIADREVGEGKEGLAREPGSRLDLRHVTGPFAIAIRCRAFKDTTKWR